MAPWRLSFFGKRGPAQPSATAFGGHRLRKLPAQELAGGLRVAEARSLRDRLIGLAFSERMPPGHALLIRRCRSVHTFGMRYPIDVVFLDADGEILRVAGAVRRGRVLWCRRARAVLELAAGEAERLPRTGIPLDRTSSATS